MAGNELTFGQSAALSAGQGLLNFGLGLAANAIQNRQQRKLMALQQKYQKDMYDYTFDKQNQYNLPSEQIARMKEAGLNPNLAYGQVQNATMSGATGSLPNAQASPFHAGQIDFALGSQINQAKSSANLDNTQAEYAKSMKRNQDIKNIYDAKRYLGDTADKFIEAELRNLNTQADYNEKRIDEISQNIAESEQRIDESKQRVAESIARELNIKQDTANKVVEQLYTGAKINEVKQNILESNSRISKNQAEIVILQTQARLLGIEEQFAFTNAYNKASILSQDALNRKDLNESTIKEINARANKLLQEKQNLKNRFGATDWTGLINQIDDFRIWLESLNK